jgi:hypothetical protein
MEVSTVASLRMIRFMGKVLSIRRMVLSLVGIGNTTNMFDIYIILYVVVIIIK